MQTQSEIAENAVFIAYDPWKDRHHHRRIVSVHKGIVVYCKGADKSYCCKMATFQKWLRKTAAVRKLKREEYALPKRLEEDARMKK